MLVEIRKKGLIVIKKILLFLISASLLTLLFLTSAFANSSPMVLINGEKVTFEVPPYVQKNELLLPVRQLSETLKAKVEWDAKKKTAWIHNGMMHIEVPLEKRELYIHRDADFSGIPEVVKLKDPIRVVRGRTFLPVKVLADCFGLQSTWDEETKIMTIKTETAPEGEALSYTEVTRDEISVNSTLNSWYEKNNQVKGIHYIRNNTYVYVLISAGEKPTGGYTVEIDSVKHKAPDSAAIEAHVTPPGDNVRVMMMVTYPSKLIRINSEIIKHVEGQLREENKPVDGKVVWVTMDSETVKSMELFSLDQQKIRDLDGPELDKVMNSFNEAILNPNPFIEMITGGTLKVTLTDGRTISFTSYGSETNVVAAFKTREECHTYHLTAPVIAQILLQAK